MLHATNIDGASKGRNAPKPLQLQPRRFGELLPSVVLIFVRYRCEGSPHRRRRSSRPFGTRVSVRGIAPLVKLGVSVEMRQSRSKKGKEMRISLSRWIATAGAVCLVAGPVGQFVQYLVTPIDEGASTSTQVAQAAAHLTQMRWAIPLDLFILLVAPAVLYAGSLAGARLSKLAAAGAGLVYLTWLGAGYLLATDILLYLAATAENRTAAVVLVDGYLSYPLVEGLVVAYLVGHVVGFVLLGLALWRARAVPRWGGIAVAAWPFIEVAGEASGVRVLAAVGFALLAVGFAACAVEVVRRSSAAAKQAANLCTIASTVPAGT